MTCFLPLHGKVQIRIIVLIIIIITMLPVPETRSDPPCFLTSASAARPLVQGKEWPILRADFSAESNPRYAKSTYCIAPRGREVAPRLFAPHLAAYISCTSSVWARRMVMSFPASRYSFKVSSRSVPRPLPRLPSARCLGSVGSVAWLWPTPTSADARRTSEVA